MNLKLFAQRLHSALDEIDFPHRIDERIDAFAKLMDLPKFKAESLLTGAAGPDPQLLQRLAEELEVEQAWLQGEES